MASTRSPLPAGRKLSEYLHLNTSLEAMSPLPTCILEQVPRCTQTCRATREESGKAFWAVLKLNIIAPPICLHAQTHASLLCLVSLVFFRSKQTILGTAEFPGSVPGHSLHLHKKE